MPYLGPRTFQTAPLTSVNLKTLDQTPSTLEDIPLSINIRQPKLSSKENYETVDWNNRFSFDKKDNESQITNVNSVSTVSGSSSQMSKNPASTSASSSSENELEIIPKGFSSHQHDDDTKTIDEDVKTIILNNPSLDSLNNESAQLEKEHPLLRKKSGELVKSSLKLNEHLHRSNSMPNTKSVKFADCLENVKYFDKFQKPNAVSKLSILDMDNSDDEFDDRIDDHQHPFSDDDDDSLFSDDNNNSNSSKWEIIKNDVPFNPHSLNFLRLNSNKEVILESLKLNSSKTAIIGFAFVQNLAFKKELIVKLTYDNWQSYIEIENANYISSNHIFKYLDSSCSYDKFSFIIKLDTLSIFSNYLEIQFCVEYIVNNKSYWDNNNNKNYTLTLKKLDSNSKNSDNFNETKKIKNEFDDINIKLKNNNNFVDSFTLSQQQQQQQQQQQINIKKVRSESSLAEMKSKSFTPPLFETKIVYPPNASNRRAKSLAVPASTDSTGLDYYKKVSIPTRTFNQSQCVPKNMNDYNKLIENFCFYGSNHNNNNNRSSQNNKSAGPPISNLLDSTTFSF